MKVGIFRCMQTEDLCPGSTCFMVVKNKKCVFEEVEDEIEMIGFSTCGGCPGKKVISRAKEMVRRGADTIVLASCMTRGTPIQFSCPYVDRIIKALESNLSKEIVLIKDTH